MKVRNHLRRARATLTAVAGLTLLAAVAAGAAAGPASATARPGRAARPAGAVFVQTDSTAGNQVIAYYRAPGGTLSPAGSYATGGLGGVLAGSVVDHLASQGSLRWDRRQDLLLAVNAGSNTVSAFGVRGDRLVLRQVIGSGGTFPVSIASRGALVYVLNAENGGSVQGYRVIFGRLFPVPGGNRALGLDPSATPQFTNTPGQVAFSADGRQLIVTTKANGNDIDVFGVRPGGGLSASPVVNSEPGAVPFAVAFDQGYLVVAEAGPNALATFALHRDGTLTQADSLANGQSATCWVTRDGTILFASNAGSGTVSRYAVSGGTLSLLGETSTDAGTVDSAVSRGGRYLYVQAGGSGIVDEYAVAAGGSLTPIGSVTVPGAAGGEGIAAS